MDKAFISKLLANYKPGYSLEQDFYTNSDVFKYEMEAIFERHWLYAGNLAQIPKSGDYFLFKIQNQSVIIIRGAAGEVYAHYNSCSHRGSAICLADTGNTQKLVCPYHQWIYDKNGKLVKARMFPDDFDVEKHGLKSVAIETVEGLIFISLAENPPNFIDISEKFSKYLQPYSIGKAKVAAIKHYHLKANWKLVAENFRECYHCGGAHPEYCNAVVGASLKENTEALTAQKNEMWKLKGLNTQLHEVEEGSTSYAVRYPLREGVESYSLDGKAVSIPMGLHTDNDAGVVGLVNYPNFWMDAVADYVWLMKVIPIDAANTQVEFCWLVDEKAIEGIDYQLNNLTKFWEVTGEQDAKLCENNYAGIITKGYRPGPYAAVEDQVVNFVDWCVAQMKRH